MKTLPSALILIMVALPTVGTAHSLQQEPPLRVSESLESDTADLERFVLEYMQERELPGVCIALLREGEVSWIRGFGAENVLTGRPVTQETLFEVGSNSKAVTAYLALQLVDRGLLSLDEPLNSYLPEPWLPPSQYRDAITLRHVLSHSSGLGHNTTSRYSVFPPGRGYSYSAIGYQYLQAVVEQVTGRPLEESAQELLFLPLGMSSSSFLNKPELTPRTANGHLHALVPVSLFLISFGVSLALIGLPGLVILRIRTKRLRPSRRMVVGALMAACGAAFAPPFVLFGMVGLWEFAWLVTFSGGALIIAFALLLFGGRIVIIRILAGRAGGQRALMILWGLLIISGLVVLASTQRNLPVPRWPGVKAVAAGSMRSTAGDMAKFLAELCHPCLLSPETASQLRKPQVALSNELSWGLGPGILHGKLGDALWQWGQHIDFQSIMIVYPDHGFGVVVLTNSDFFGPDVALDIAQRALGGDFEPVRQAMHLGFDYREDP